jgi:ABC-type transport system involved in multi-copper enzyme maturation permease subunit
LSTAPNALPTKPSTLTALRAVVGYTMRSALPGRRWLGALLAAATSVLFGLLSTTLPDTAEGAFAGVAANALFTLVLPVTCLVIGDAVLGAEVRSGTFTFTWMSPVPTWLVAIGRWLGGTLAAAGTLAVAFALAAVVAGAPDAAAPIAISGAFGAAAYVAVFIAIGCITKRAAVWSLAFVFLVERLLGAALAGIAQLSPSWEARAAFVGLSDVRDDLEREGIPHGSAALVRLAVITVVALVLASSRLRSLKHTGSAD